MKKRIRLKKQKSKSMREVLRENTTAVKPHVESNEELKSTKYNFLLDEEEETSTENTTLLGMVTRGIDALKEMSNSRNESSLVDAYDAQRARIALKQDYNKLLNRKKS